MPGWGFAEYVLLAFVLPLIVASAFFSGSETALFGLSENEKLRLRRRNTISSRAVNALLADPHMLLITILSGNMTVNVLYFTITSVLIMHTDTNVATGAALAAGTLVFIVLFGEVLPKLFANAHRESVSLSCAPLLLTLHRVTTPLRLLVDGAVVTPLSQLTAPTAAPPRLDAEELAALLDVTRDQGVIDIDEQRLMRDVIEMGRLKVREIMTPRVRMPAIAADASRERALAMLRKHRAALIPLFSQSQDEIVGVLDAMALLREQETGLKGAANGPRTPGRSANRLPTSAILRAVFVPELATVDHALNHLRACGARSAVVVDEYGGTSGFVTIDNVISQIARHDMPQQHESEPS